MKRYDLIPSHKSDYDTVKKLVDEDRETIKELIPDLLIWIQDGNWPIAHNISSILKPLETELVPHIKSVLDSNDGEWKYFMLVGLVQDLNQEVLQQLKGDLIRIAQNPTRDEEESGADEAAQELLERI